MTLHKYTVKDNKSTYVVPTTVEHIEEFVHIIREEDKEEVMASHGDLLTGLIESFTSSLFCETIFTPDDEIAGIYGVCPLTHICPALPTLASPWMLSTVHLPKVYMAFLRGGREWIEKVNKEFPVLTNCVDAEYKVSIAWLKFMGFEFINRIENYGVNPKPFLEFVRINKE